MFHLCALVTTDSIIIDKRRENPINTSPTNKPPLLFFSFFTMALVAESRFHVLAVDDSIIDRKLIERLLKTSSYQVTAVDSGSKALEFLGLVQDEQEKENSPSSSAREQNEIAVNLVITDYCMPGMTGYDLLKKIKDSQSLKDIPVVIMSSENEPSRINRCLEDGAEEFLLKPVKLSDVNRLRPHMLKGKNKDQQDVEKQTQQQTQTEAQSINTSSSNKRKAMDHEALSPERTRPRLTSNSSLTV